MSRICILTDSTAHFPYFAFNGHEHVSVIPHTVRFRGEHQQDHKDLPLIFTQAEKSTTPIPQAFPPSAESFLHTFANLANTYSEIVAILISSHLSQTVQIAQKAASLFKGPASISVIDSQTTAAGLGLLVRAAAEAAQRGMSSAEINRVVRGLIRHIYMILCLPDLHYLSQSGQLDPAQAVIGEMLGVIPFYILENGRLVPVQKARNPRNLVDIFHEFVSEFDQLRHLALLQGLPGFEQESRNLRERIHQCFPSTPFSEHTMNASLATILGPHSLGLIAMEHPNKDIK